MKVEAPLIAQGATGGGDKMQGGRAKAEARRSCAPMWRMTRRALHGFRLDDAGARRSRRLADAKESVMTNDDDIPNLKKNQYLFAGVGAVLGGLVGAGVAGAAT